MSSLPARLTVDIGCEKCVPWRHFDLHSFFIYEHTLFPLPIFSLKFCICIQALLAPFLLHLSIQGFVHSLYFYIGIHCTPLLLDFSCVNFPKSWSSSTYKTCFPFIFQSLLSISEPPSFRVYIQHPWLLNQVFAYQPHKIFKHKVT